MSARESPASSIGALTDRELEILRLLTAGHTVKSIAAHLGRSETSINERLRDARRKTGIGSSRELARHVAAQKNWDKKIDLPPARSTADQQEQPANQGRLWSKGTIIMLIAIAVAAAGLVVAEADLTRPEPAPQFVQAAATTELPLVGKWSLDISRLPADEDRPRSVVMDFRVSANQVWTTTCDIVTADGSTQHGQAIAAADGVPVALSGNMIFADMVSLRQPAPNTLVLTFTKGGAPVSSRVYTIEDDRRSMKETIIWAGDITPRTVTTYFDRVG